MKNRFFLLIPLIFVFAHNVAAQDMLDLDIDSLDSLFEESLPEPEQAEEASSSTVFGDVKKRGLFFSASYEFIGGIAPGWDQRPWEFDGEEEFSWGPGIKMLSGITIDARLSEAFRVITTLNYSIPGFDLILGDFFFDYNFLNRVFLRAGKYEHSWGISGFTNLLARIPENAKDGSVYGPSYIIKADIPIGVGGIQLLALTRSDIAHSKLPTKSDIGYGGKYNLALRWADFDMGIFYQDNMALRGFLSAKTTLWNTEFYNEWLVAVNVHSDNAASFAVNLGWGRDFFNGKISMGGEFFYNGEGSSYFYKPQTSLRDAETIPFADLFGLSFNFFYRVSGYGNPRFFVSVNYLPAQASAQLIPGFRITPLSHIDVYLAVPMVFGSKDGYYYNHSSDLYNRPFSIMLLVTLSGDIRVGWNF